MDYKKLLDYDKWASNQIIQSFDEADDSSNLSDAFILMAHLLQAQHVWLNRINKNSGTSNIWPEPEKDSFSEKLTENHLRLLPLVSNIDEEIGYKNSKGQEFTNTVGEILMHLIIHGQHHRAQIATLLRKSGIEPPATNFISFVRN